ncbi:MAG: TIR domain-containing protein [Deltaproteobacteria bacterium]|nr:TIR domain-containing protein [Deltaproteobacteria bacterium]
MNDIFISYDSTDRATAQKFADALKSLGWSVWWNREIPLGKRLIRWAATASTL